VGLISYAELAVRLVNSAGDGAGRHDQLSDPDAFRAMVPDRDELLGPVGRGDLESLRQLRTELAAIFAACADRNPGPAVDRLNALLISHPIHPVISPAPEADQGIRDRGARTPGPGWQLSLNRSGSVADRYAAAAVAGLATLITELGPARLNRCGQASCPSVLADTSAAGGQRFCPEHGDGKATVTAFRIRRRPNSAAG
jgi:Putative stress-induced transcription regulator